MTAVSRKETRSQTLFKILSKRRKGATVEDLAEATGLKASYLGSYISEFKRVYGAKVKYRKQTKRYHLSNVTEVRRHLAS